MSLLGKTAKLARSRSFELLIGAAIVLATLLFLEHGYTGATPEKSDQRAADDEPAVSAGTVRDSS